MLCLSHMFSTFRQHTSSVFNVYGGRKCRNKSRNCLRWSIRGLYKVDCFILKTLFLSLFNALCSVFSKPHTLYRRSIRGEASRKRKLEKDGCDVCNTSLWEAPILALLQPPSPSTTFFSYTVFAYTIFYFFFSSLQKTCTRKQNGSHKSLA